MTKSQDIPGLIELLPCPFCGGAAYLRQWSDAARVECALTRVSGETCGFTMRTYLTASEAIAAWNRRAAAPKSEGAVPGEPVAYRHRFDVEEEDGWDWEYSTERPNYTPFGEEHAIVEPLYTTPSNPLPAAREEVGVHHHPDNQPSPALDRLVDAAAAQLRTIASNPFGAIRFEAIAAKGEHEPSYLLAVENSDGGGSLTPINNHADYRVDDARASWLVDAANAALHQAPAAPSQEAATLGYVERHRDGTATLHPFASPPGQESGPLTEIAAERERQKSVEGWNAKHDDEHTEGQLGLAAACYASSTPLRAEFQVSDGARSAGEGSAAFPPTEWLDAWPWDAKWWKPTDRRRSLIKAGALIVAEVERLDRAAGQESGVTKP